LNTESGEISLEPAKQLGAPCTQDVDDDLLVIETSWPGTTVGGGAVDGAPPEGGG